MGHIQTTFLTGAHLPDADLTGADLQSTSLAVAGLWHINLTGAKLCNASFDRFSTYNNRTERPENLAVPEVETNYDALSDEEQRQFEEEWRENHKRILREARSR